MNDNKAPTRRILMVRLSAVGDIVHALPSAAALRKVFPESIIGWLVDNRYRDVLQDCPVIDELIPIDTSRLRRFPPRGLGQALGEVRNVRARGFQTAVDLQGLMKSGLTARLSGADTRIGFGWGRTREHLAPLFSNRRITPPPEIKHVVLRNLYLVERAFGFKHSGEPVFPFGIDEDIDGKITETMETHGLDRFAIMTPGGGWSSKLWPAKRYTEVAEWILKETGLGIFINFGPGEEPLASSLVAGLKDGRIASFPTTLREYIHLARHAVLYVGSDSGPYHIAMAHGVPSVGIFGPSDPEQCGPWDTSHPVVWTREECAPCYKRTCEDPKCMEKITADRVIEAIKKALP